MKDEIKEILDKCTPFLFGDEVDKLTNYITNLQESEAYYYGQYKDYKSRNKKAIEYLEQPYRDNFDYSKAELLNILNGDDNETRKYIKDNKQGYGSLKYNEKIILKNNIRNTRNSNNINERL